MKKTNLLINLIIVACFGILFTNQSYAQMYVGHKQITFTDPARSDRSIPCDVYYPTGTAPASGSTTTEDASFSAGQFPLIVFGHGFVMGDPNLYYYLPDTLAKLGYIFVFPTTENTGPLPAPSHIDFGLDLAFLNNQIKSENTVSTSFFYQKIGTTSAIMGHSMGGKASILAAANNTNITTVVTLGAAMSNPPVGDGVDAFGEYAPYITVPAVIFDAEFDCVVPVEEGHKLIYDTLTNACKTYVNILGGGHCFFASQAGSGLVACETGEGNCSGSFTITREAQNATVLQFVIPYLKYKLKGDAASWIIFNGLLNASSTVTFEQSCPTTEVENNEFISSSNNFTLYPNPAENQFNISFNNNQFNEFEVVIINSMGQIVRKFNETKSSKNFNKKYNINDLSNGFYYVSINANGINQATLKLIK